MADGVVQLLPDGSGKKVDTSEVTVGSNTVERQRINISDPTDPLAHAAVENSNTIVGNEYGLVTQDLLRDIYGALKYMTNLIARGTATTIDPTTGKQRVLVTIDAAQTLTTLTTCATVTSMSQLATFDAKQTLLYSNERQTWAANVRSRIT